MTAIATAPAPAPADSSSPAARAEPGSKGPAAVVGAGLAGLTAAVTLAARGFEVTVFDKNPWAGGKAALLRGEAPDGGSFRFDMGPTILTVPEVLERVFSEAGVDLHERLDLVRLADPQWRCFFDGHRGAAPGSDTGGDRFQVLDLKEDVAAMQAELERFTGDGKAAGDYGAFVEYTRKLHRISDDFYFWKSIGGLKDMFSFGGTMNASTLKDVAAMRMWSTVAGTVRKMVPDDRVAQMLDHYTQYVGSDPGQAPAILCGIAAMQVDRGVWYPRGGTRAVPVALRKLAEELGVTFRLGAEHEVTRIHRTGAGRKQRVAGVELADGTRLGFPTVISNADSVRTRHELLNGETHRNGKATSGDPEPACSGVVLYLGLNKRYEHLAHHNFVFSRDPEEEFEHIYREGTVAPDPTAYLAATAATEEAGGNPETFTAPEGGEALYVLVHAPHLRPGQDWDREGPLFRNYRDTILDKLEATAGLTGLRDRIVYENALTPQGIHDRYKVLNGAIYGLASHGRLGGGFKPGNRRPELPGLYLAGGSAHPGPGMPMVMMSGYIAADAADLDAARSPAAG